MRRQERGPRAIPLLVGTAVGVAYPLVDLALSCRVPDSEACVWGKAYLPLTLAVSLVLLGGISALVTYALVRRRGNKSGSAI